MTPRHHHSPRTGLTYGFTLIETMIAMALLGMGILSLTGSVTIVTRLVDSGSAATRAAFVALARFEAVRGATLAAGSTCPGSASSGGPSGVGQVTESWATWPGQSSVTVVVEVVRWDGRRQTTDTLGTAVPC